MKDYYKILGVPENCTEADIKKAFRKLAFAHHPDTNPGNEKQAEARFKEINEAYGVLGDGAKRQQYDSARKSPFAGIGHTAGYQGFQYSQQDIFNGLFSNRAMYEELNKMFTSSGLRFDQEFLNNIFFSGQGIGFRFFTGPGSGSPAPGRRYSDMKVRKPSWLQRMLGKIIAGLFNYILKKLMNAPANSIPGRNLDYHVDLDISPEEATSGGEKQFTYRRNGQSKNLVVKLPSGIRTGNRIRLKGMGMVVGNKTGDLYLNVRVKE